MDGKTFLLDIKKSSDMENPPAGTGGGGGFDKHGEMGNGGGRNEKGLCGGGGCVLLFFSGEGRI